MEQLILNKPTKSIPDYYKEQMIVDTVNFLDISKFQENYKFRLLLEEQLTSRMECVELVVKAQDKLESDNIEMSQYYADNISKLESYIIEKYNSILTAYKDSIDNAYSASDINSITTSEKCNKYYTWKVYKNIPKTDNYIELDILLSRNAYIHFMIFITALFANNISDAVYSLTDKSYNNSEFVIVDHAKLDASTKSDACYISHYTAGCGPSELRFNVYTPTARDGSDSKLQLKEPLNKTLYDSWYKKDPVVRYYFYNNINDIFYIIVPYQSKHKVFVCTGELGSKLRNLIQNEQIFSL